MIVKEIVQGKKADLRQLELSDCGGCYADWLNDPDISRYMETKWIVWDQASIQEFVKTQQKSSHSVIFAIVEHETGRHIGNLKIGPIHPQYHHADISYFIGDKKLHGGGYATEAVGLACRYGFERLGLHRIEAGTYACAAASQRVLEKNGFRKEGVFKEQVYFEDGYIDIFRYARLNTGAE